MRLVALRAPYHEATHFGLVQIRARDHAVREHLMAVNKWSETKVDAHIQKAFALWEERSAKTWELDIKIITAAGIEVTGPVVGEDRKTVAVARTKEVRAREGFVEMDVLYHMMRNL